MPIDIFRNDGWENEYQVFTISTSAPLPLYV